MVVGDIGDEITKEQFAKFVRVQKSGVTNMFDVVTVSRLSGLQRKTIVKIMETYNELSIKYPDVVD
ncbi:hypothetical protein CMI37_09300 [Candidatus Pacearchaeota archaeon]|nr:hypothetical protein [Candidatus Pacearchaeota archaeon]|tara:strand:+ start:1927 stop:2124 length:198 start_codon:yes stop_codon:yes gene_type:complete